MEIIIDNSIIDLSTWCIYFRPSYLNSHEKSRKIASGSIEYMKVVLEEIEENYIKKCHKVNDKTPYGFRIFSPKYKNYNIQILLLKETTDEEFSKMIDNALKSHSFLQ